MLQKNGEGWFLKEIAYVEDWSAEQKRRIIQGLRETILAGGDVIGCFELEILIGFGAVKSRPFGSKGQYLQLSQLHVSEPFRGRGIGKALFQLLSDEAKRLGARKLYISAHSSEETQAFYRRIGCTDALEINDELAAMEPADCQIEYALE